MPIDVDKIEENKTNICTLVESKIQNKCVTYKTDTVGLP